MQIFIIPELHESQRAWQRIITILEKVGYAVTLFEYPAPKDDDLEIQTNLAEQYLTQKTVVVGSGVGGRIAIQLLARKNHHIVQTILLSTPSLPHRGWRNRLVSLLALFTLPIRLFIPYKRKVQLTNLFLRFYYRTPEALQYQNIISSDQESLLLIIKSQILLLWGTKKPKVHIKIARHMRALLTHSDLIEVAGAREPLNVHAAVVVANYIDEHARNN